MVENDSDYTIEMTGTPPKEMRFALKTDQTEGGIKVKIRYESSNTLFVKADEKTITPMYFDDDLGMPAELPKSKCGENRFIAMQQSLEFFITPGCVIKIEPNNAITGLVRMAWTFADFYSYGGTTEFVDRLASVLGIASYRIHVVQLYLGSVILGFEITPEVAIDPITGEELPPVFDDRTTIKTEISDKLPADPKNFVGIDADILGLEEDGELVAGEEIPG